jgi:A/G-specific adenine glycosylase
MDSPRVSQVLDSVASGALDDAWKRKFQPRLRRWFNRHARNLPWRETADPYRIWISEVMLQQTQVQTVIEYYQRFLEQLPDVRSLAAAEEDIVLRLWEGLGYYRRARQLHAAAKQIVDEHNGEFPRDVQSVYALPGVGRYTAHAILCFADEQRLPIVEANTQRLYARLIELEELPTRSSAQKQLWSFAEWVLPKTNVGSFNQALMELGSLVCTPKEPNCSACPVRDLCPTFASGRQAEIPVAKPKTKYESRVEVAWVVQDEKGRTVVRQCEADQRWAGLWDFPRYHPGPNVTSKAIEQSAHLLAADLKQTIQPQELLCTMRHGVTKYRISLQVKRSCPIESTTLPAPFQWVTSDELQVLPLNQTARKIAKLICDT